MYPFTDEVKIYWYKNYKQGLNLTHGESKIIVIITLISPFCISIKYLDINIATLNFTMQQQFWVFLAATGCLCLR